MSNPIKDIEYSDKLNCNFSEALYQKMIERRFGIDSCCKLDLNKLEIEKELLDLNNIIDTGLTPV